MENCRRVVTQGLRVLLPLMDSTAVLSGIVGQHPWHGLDVHSVKACLPKGLQNHLHISQVQKPGELCAAEHLTKPNVHPCM